jgi:fibronectin type 3 domain-containing protein
MGNNMVLTLTWNDNSINETSFVVQRDEGAGFVDVGTVDSPLDQPNTHGVRTFDDTTYQKNTSYSYRVVAKNTIGYGGAYMTMSVQSVSALVAVIPAPSNLTLSLLAGPQVVLTWMDNSTNETGFVIERSTDGVTFSPFATAPAHNNVGPTSYTDVAVTLGSTYFYRVAAVNALGSSAFSDIASISVTIPADPSNLVAVAVRQGNNERFTFTWADNSSNEANFIIQRATDPNFTLGLATYTANANTTTFNTGNMPQAGHLPHLRSIQILYMQIV